MFTFTMIVKAIWVFTAAIKNKTNCYSIRYTKWKVLLQGKQGYRCFGLINLVNKQVTQCLPDWSCDWRCSNSKLEIFNVTIFSRQFAYGGTSYIINFLWAEQQWPGMTASTGPFLAFGFRTKFFGSHLERDKSILIHGSANEFIQADT